MRQIDSSIPPSQPGSQAGGPERGYLSIKEAAELLGVSRVTVWRWIGAGRLAAYRSGPRTTRVKRDDLQALLSPIRQVTNTDKHASQSETSGKAPTTEADAQLSDARLSQAYLAAIVESSDDAIIGKDLDGNITSWNAGAERTYGYSAEAVIGRPISLLIPPNRPDELPAIMERLRRGKHIEQYETVRVTKDGRTINVSLSVSPIKNAYGNITGAATIARDVTQHKRAAQAASHLVAIVESSDDSIISETLDGSLTSWNPGAERLYGYRAEEVLGKPRSIIIPPERGDDFPTMQARLRQGKHIDHYETIRVRKDGQRIDVSVSMSPIRDAAGQIVGAAGIARNITARKRRERSQRFLDEATKALASSLDYMTTLSSLTSLLVPEVADYCSIYMLEEDGQLQPIQIAHAIPEKEPLLRELERLHPLEPSPQTGIDQILRSGVATFAPDVSDETLRGYARSEQELAVLRALDPRSVIIVPLIARGRALGVLSLVMAESDRRYGEEELSLAEELARRAALAVDNARLYRQAQEAILAREEFLSVASHELRTPLTTLMIHTQMLLRSIERQPDFDPNAVTKSLRGIEAQADRLNRLVLQLLDIGRLETGGLALECEETDLRQLVEATAASARATTEKHQIDVDGPSELRAFVDPLRIEQVVSNLLENAVKYSPEGGPVAVELSRAGGGNVYLAVRDHGLGIPEARRQQIFQRFYRAHGERHSSGMGLGLYISRQIVEQHGGELTAEFPEDGGTRFVVRLPTQAPD